MIAIDRIEYMDRESFLDWFAGTWKQGQHCVICGPTGSGKTFFAGQMLDIREWVCVFAVKKRDDTLDSEMFRGYDVITHWPPKVYQQRIIFNAPPSSLHALSDQSVRVGYALNKLYIRESWAIYLDDVGYICKQLKLTNEVGILMGQARSSKISNVCGLIRPHSVVQQVPLETLKMARHKFFFRYDDSDEMKSCASICGIDYKNMVQYMQSLQDFELIYCGPDAQIMVIGA